MFPGRDWVSCFAVTEEQDGAVDRHLAVLLIRMQKVGRARTFKLRVVFAHQDFRARLST